MAAGVTYGYVDLDTQDVAAAYNKEIVAGSLVSVTYDTNNENDNEITYDETKEGLQYQLAMQTIQI